MSPTLTNNILAILLDSLSEFSIYFPRVVAVLLIFIIGSWLANTIEKLVTKTLRTLKISQAIKQTPIEHFLKNAETTHKIENIIGSIFYWIVMLVVFQTSMSVLGLISLSSMLNKILSYIPNVLSAIIILLFGVLLAGLVESLVKGSIKSIDAKTGRLLGKLSSYLIMIFAILASIAELGIASEFILILFVGIVGAVSLGAGLSIGLGSKELTGKILNQWHKKTFK